MSRSQSPSFLTHAHANHASSKSMIYESSQLEALTQTHNFELQQSQIKIQQLESELRLATDLLRSREAIHADELRKVEIDNAKTIAERRLAVNKLQSVETVEDAVRDLYLSMSDRVGYGGNPTAESVRSEKEELKNTPILVVLGHLHAICKGLYLFKQEAEDDMRGAKARGVSRDDNMLLSLKQQINSLKAQLREAKIDTESANARADASDEARLRVLSESQVQVQKMSDQHQELLASLKEECETSRRLREALDEAFEEGRRRDALVMTNRQLESKRYFDRASQDKILRTLQGQHERAIKMKDLELRQVSDLRAKLAKLEMEVATLKAEKARRLKTIHQEVTSPVFDTPVSRTSSIGGDHTSVKSFVSRPGSAISAAGSQRRFTTEGSIIRSSEALMQKLRDGFAKEETAMKKEVKEAGFDELAREYTIADMSPHHKASKLALKAMRSTLSENTTEGMADLDLSGSPLATSVLFSPHSKSSKKKSTLAGQSDYVKGAASGWGVQGATGLEPRSVSFKIGGSASQHLQAIKNKIDAQRIVVE